MDDELTEPGSAFGAPEEPPFVADVYRYRALPDPPNPYGTRDLDSRVQAQPGPPRRVRCYHRDCKQWLRPPAQGFPGDLCPEHLIRCHGSAGGATYSYGDARRNIIVGADLLAERIVGHPFKYESDRLGLEKSEDALSWNVLRSLQEVGVLREVAEWLTGLVIPDEPRLYLWGLRVDGDSIVPWDLLISARERFEQNLPVERPLTEPDIALHLPGRYLILIEAKFTSVNPFYTNGPRKDAKSLTKEELITIYQDPALKILDVAKATRASRIHYQLWRNMVFAEWMAMADGTGTRAYHASLTRLGQERESCDQFRELLRPGFAGRFVHQTWEEIDDLWAARLPGLSRLHRYLETKTAGLVPAFRLGSDSATCGAVN
jgi:hypothetical protein